MELLSTTTIAFGLKILQEIGILEPSVFSPIHLLLFLSQQNANNHNSLKRIPLEANQVSKLAEISKNGFLSVEHLNLINASLTATWRYQYLKSHRKTMRFKTSNGKIKHLKFVYANTSLSEELVSNNEGFRIAQDDLFSVLEIPLIGKSLRYLIFLPTTGVSLEESLKNLDSERVKNLLDQMTVANVHFKIPFFQMCSTIDTAKLLGLTSSKFHKLHLDWKKPKTNHYEGIEDFDESFIKRPPDRTPYHFVANRPFIFAVFNDTLSIVMGLFTGTNVSQ